MGYLPKYRKAQKNYHKSLYYSTVLLSVRISHRKFSNLFSNSSLQGMAIVPLFLPQMLGGQPLVLYNRITSIIFKSEEELCSQIEGAAKSSIEDW